MIIPVIALDRPREASIVGIVTRTVRGDCPIIVGPLAGESILSLQIKGQDNQSPTARRTTMARK